MNPPVREGEEYDVTIENEGNKGDGVTRITGYVIFVPEAKTGKKYRIRITKVLDKFGFGEII